MNSPPDSWLDPAAAEAQRAQAELKALEVSRLYLVFESGAAKELLAMWEEACLNKRTPVNAPLTQYAADEAIRGFVAGIRKQIAKAKEVPQQSTQEVLAL